MVYDAISERLCIIITIGIISTIGIIVVRGYCQNNYHQFMHNNQCMLFARQRSGMIEW